MSFNEAETRFYLKDDQNLVLRSIARQSRQEDADDPGSFRFRQER